MGDVIALPGVDLADVRPVTWLDRLLPGRKALVVEAAPPGFVVRLAPARTEKERAIWARYSSREDARDAAHRAVELYPSLYQFVVDEGGLA